MLTNIGLIDLDLGVFPTDHQQEIPTLEWRNRPTKGPSCQLAASSSLHARAAAPHELSAAPQRRIAGGSPPPPEKRGKGREEEKGKKGGANGLKPSKPENSTRSLSRSQQECDTRHVAISKVLTRPLTDRQVPDHALRARAPDHASRMQAPQVNATPGTSPSHLRCRHVARSHSNNRNATQGPSPSQPEGDREHVAFRTRHPRLRRSQDQRWGTQNPRSYTKMRRESDTPERRDTDDCRGGHPRRDTNTSPSLDASVPSHPRRRTESRETGSYICSCYTCVN
ncbi:hypothetical protein Taro_024481, partial [Colocasia esculenta]|nr:hypothetical protein [Colocasia esculenta]